MKKQTKRRNAVRTDGDTNKRHAGLYGSQAPKPGARPASGDTVVQSKPGGSGHGEDSLSKPGYLEESAEQELDAQGKPGSPRKTGMAPR
jgi:hypothetical protein